MKRFFLAIFFTFALAVSSFATAITVGSYQVTNLWTYGGTSASIRIFARQTFTTNDSVTVLAGSLSSLYQSVPCTVTNLIVTCNSFTLNSTTNSSVPTAKYVAYLVDYKGIPRVLYLDNFSLGTSHGLNVTWPQIRADNLTVVGSLPNTYYTATQTDAAIAAAITGAGGFSSSWGSITGTLASQSDLQSALDTKQATLVSGTNIKTLNSQSLLGPGDIAIAGGSSITLANTYSNSLATAISTIGSTPTLLTIDADTTISTPLTVPATLVLKVINNAKIIESGSGAIEFQGLGIADPESQTPIFSGFTIAYDILSNVNYQDPTTAKVRWTGTVFPPKISANLWDNSDMFMRAMNAIEAVSGEKSTVVIYPGSYLHKVYLRAGLSLHMTAGTYTSLIFSSNISGDNAAFVLENNTTVYGDGQGRTVFVESPNNNVKFFVVSGMEFPSAPSQNNDIYIRDITFIGTATNGYNSAQSAVNLGNMQHGSVTRCSFLNLRGFAAYVGGFSNAAGIPHANGVWITDNFVEGLGTQQIGTVGGDDIHITGNTFDVTSTPAFYLNDVVTNGTTTITSATGGFVAGMVGASVRIEKNGQAPVTKVISSFTNANTVVLDTPMAYTDTAVSLYISPPSASIIDIEPNADTDGSKVLDISNNILNGSLSLVSWNGITIQKAFGGGTDYVKVANNIIIGHPYTTANWTSADVNTTTDTITIYNHNMRKGQTVQVQGILPGGLTGPTFYGYVIPVDKDHIKIAYTFADAMLNTPADLTTTGGDCTVIPISAMANGIQMFSTGLSEVSGNTITGGGQFGLDLEGNYRLTAKNNTIYSAGMYSLQNVHSDFIGNVLSVDPIVGLTQGASISEDDDTLYPVLINTTAGSPLVTFPAADSPLLWWNNGLRMKLNGADYTIANRVGSNQLKLVSNVPETTITKTFADADVNTATDTITVTAHGLNTGAGLSLSSTGTLPAGLTSLMFVIRTDADHFKLASTYNNALAGTAVDITAAAGGGTHTVKNDRAIIYFSTNRYIDNTALNLTIPSGNASHVYTFEGGRAVAVSYAPAQITSDQNDYQPSVVARRYDLASDASHNITGLTWINSPLTQTPQNAQRVVFYNAGAQNIVLKNEDVGSTAAYRFHNSTGADITIGPSESADLEYNAPLTRWVVTKKGGSTAASSSNIGSLFFDNTQLQHVNHGIFWRPNVQYGHFFWEATVKPEEGAGWSGYMVTDSQGGAHNLLWGMQTAATGFYGITGNVMMGSPPPVTITSVDTTNDTLTATAHGFWTGAMVTMASTGTLPGGLSPGTYYVIKIDADTIRLATTINNAEAATPVYVDLTSVGSGTITAAWFFPNGLITFGGGDEIPYDNWTRLAVAWDGTSLLTWVNGVLSSITPFEGPYRLNPGGNNATLSIGGSDHSNYRGYIAEVRGYEGVDAAIPNSDYIPEMIMRPSQTFDNGATVTEPQFFTNYTAESTIYPDLSGGFEGHFHHGIPEAVQGQSSQAGSIVGTSLSLPTFVRGAVTFGTYTPTPPSTPAGALIWDSFSRVNRNYLNPQDKTLGYYKLGNTEAGSLGIKTWTLPDGSADTSGHGILNGAAFIQNQADNVCVDTGTQDVDVRVDRGITEWFGRTGLLVRYKDANDYYVIDALDSAISVIKHEAGVVTGVTYVPTFGWKTLRVTAKGTAFNVYWGTATEGSFTLLGSFTGTNVTGATKECLYRPSAVKTVYRYDNFLVKAAP